MIHPDFYQMQVLFLSSFINLDKITKIIKIDNIDIKINYM